jgi:ABC-type antimicrobial peptide transport system permease subunit
VLLSSLALAIGFALGFAGHLYLDQHGFDLRDLYGTDVEMAGVTLDDLLVRSIITPAKWIVGTVSVFVLFVLTALYPAWRAVRLDPAKAMRTFQ